MTTSSRIEPRKTKTRRSQPSHPAGGSEAADVSCVEVVKAEAARAALDKQADPEALRRRRRKINGTMMPGFRVVANGAIAGIVWTACAIRPDPDLAWGAAAFLGLSILISIVQRQLALRDLGWVGREFLLVDFIPYAVLIAASGGDTSPFFWFGLLRVADQPGVRTALTRMFAVGAVASLILGILLADGPSGLFSADGVMRIGLVIVVAAYLILGSQISAGMRYQLHRTIEMARGLIAEIDDQNEEMAALAAKAEKLAKVKGEFLATMSHEIRTPVNGILGSAELMLHDGLPEPQRELAEIIHSSADTLLYLINDILDLSKLEAGKMEIEEVPIELKPWAEETLAIVRKGRPKPDVRLELEIAPDVPPFVLGDPVRLRQLVLNVAGNGIKFTERGSVVVGVRRQGEALVLSVADTGIGMSREAVASVFEAFAQADASTTRRFGGTGLGLAICRRLVEAMDGRIEVSSELGEGSTFSIFLPLREAEPAASPTEPGSRETGLGSFELAVLVAEDNHVNVKVARRLFERLGVEIDVAANGLEAIQKVSERPYDVVFMDMQMPEMDGLEATKVICETLENPPPIVALTANALAEDEMRCREAGMIDFLSKPLRLQSLSDCLSKNTGA